MNESTDGRNILLIDMSPELVKEKRYDLRLIFLANRDVVMLNGRRVIQMPVLYSDFSELGLSTYKRNMFIDKMVELGVFEQDADNGVLYMNQIKKGQGYYITVDSNDAIIYAQKMDPLKLKLLCYLVCHKQIFKNECMFSMSKIVKDLGYSRNNNILVKLKDFLKELQDEGFIKYSDDLIGVAGVQGLFRKLYSAKLLSGDNLKVLDGSLLDVGNLEKELNNLYDAKVTFNTKQRKQHHYNF